MEICETKIGPKGQIILPKEIREKYQLLVGDDVLILPTEEGVLIRHKKAPLRGFLAGKIDIEGFEKDLKELRKEWSL
ncbi:MAG: AbrB/MazE/SpoVT family DNA-binding domain-containing protein [Methanosarcinales archaeon]